MNEQLCRNCKGSFLIRPDDESFYAKIGVPPPTHCPRCRQYRRYAFRNERNLYRRSCDACHASIISIYSPDKPVTVYCQTCWWSDSWSAEQYGREVDVSRSFFEQINELMEVVPRCALYNVNGTNSEYCQQVVNMKDCYLCFVMKGSESCMYTGYTIDSRDCVDCSFVRNCELCFECVDAQNLYNCDYAERCTNSNNLTLCYDLVGCQDCFGCVGLRNKQYYLFNKPYSKEEYRERRKAITSGESLQRAREIFETLKQTYPHRDLWNINVEHVSGNNLNNCKNVFECYDAFDLQDCAYSTWIFKSRDVYDCYGMGESELVYEGIGNEEVNNCFFSMFVTNSSDVHYSDSCFSSRKLFGCVGVKKGEFAILNRRYPEEEYHQKVAHLRTAMIERGEYGEFFPVNLSSFNVAETIANDL